MWYNQFSYVYDWFLEKLYQESRTRAVGTLNSQPGHVVLDVPCGTGLSHRFIQNQITSSGKLIAIDRSKGMLKKSKGRSRRNGWNNVIHLEMDAARVDRSTLEQYAGVRAVDGVFCGLGLTAIADWESVFESLFGLLKENGRFVIYDVHSAKASRHSFAVELVARADLSRECWTPLERLTSDFQFETLSTDTRKFGGTLYVAHGTKSNALTQEAVNGGVSGPSAPDA